MGKILKQSHYNRVPETMLGIIIPTIFLSLRIVDLLSRENKMPDRTYTAQIIIFSGLLLFYSWRLFAKKPQVHYVNINGWVYQLFQKMSKWKFICINGFLRLMRTAIMFAIVFLSQLIKNELSPFQIILIITSLCLISVVPYGYISYKNCAAVNMDS